MIFIVAFLKSGINLNVAIGAKIIYSRAHKHISECVTSSLLYNL